MTRVFSREYRRTLSRSAIFPDLLYLYFLFAGTLINKRISRPEMRVRRKNALHARQRDAI